MEKHKACKYLQILYNNVEKQKSSDVQSNKCFLCVKNQLFQMFASHLTRFAWMKRWTSINTETCSKVLVHDADVFRGRLSITFRHQTLRRPAHSRFLESNRSGPQRTVPFQWCSAGSDERTSCCDAIQVPCWWGCLQHLAHVSLSCFTLHTLVAALQLVETLKDLGQEFPTFLWPCTHSAFRQMSMYP